MPLSEKAKENKKQYIREYSKENLKRIPLDVQKDKYEEIKEASIKAGETVNGYIKKAIDDRLKSNKQKCTIKARFKLDKGGQVALSYDNYTGC